MAPASGFGIFTVHIFSMINTAAADIKVVDAFAVYAGGTHLDVEDEKEIKDRE